MKHYVFVMILAVATVLAAACSPATIQENAAAAESSDPQITVMEPWSRPSPMKAGNGAVYMMLMNKGNSDDVLLSAETDVAETVELHETKMENDVMKMGPIPNIEVPAGGSATLEPGGKHVMLINLQEELVPGEKISLTLNFEKSGSVTVEAEIREMGQAMDSSMKMEHNMERK
jgi:copper(I)-binding protein